MTKQEFDVLYLGKAVHCDTEEKANAFLKLAHGVGYRWSNGSNLTDVNTWERYKKGTCYTIVDTEGSMMYSPKDFYEKEGYTIVEFAIDKKEEVI